MTIIEVTTDKFAWPTKGMRLEAERDEPDAWNPSGSWSVQVPADQHHVIGPKMTMYDYEVIIPAPPKHRSFYDENHPGELEPDAYDRMSYKYDDHGRHILHTGTE